MRRSERAFPLRCLALHVATGFGVAALFVAGLMLLGRGGLGDLLWRVGGPGALARLWGGCGLTFGAVMFASGVMSLGHGGGRHGAGRRVPVPAVSLAARAPSPK